MATPKRTSFKKRSLSKEGVPRRPIISSRDKKSAPAGTHTSPFKRMGSFFSESPQRIKIALVCLAVIVLLGALFPAARDYYRSYREKQDLETYYKELKDTNKELKDDIKELQTTEGIEDEARRRGYIAEGETLVKIQGSADQIADGDQKEARAGRSSKKGDKRSLFVKIADFIFGYKEKKR